jgi:hypothetical protein
MTMAKCPVHGRYLVRIRLAPEEDGTLRVSRLIYEGASEAAASYDRAVKQSQPRRSRRRRKKSNGEKRERSIKPW